MAKAACRPVAQLSDSESLHKVGAAVNVAVEVWCLCFCGGNLAMVQSVAAAVAL